MFIPLTTCSWWPSFPLKIGRDHGLETGKPLSTLVYGAEGTTTRTTSTDGSRPLTERDSDSLEPGGGCVDRSGTTSLRPSDTRVTVNFSPFLLSLASLSLSLSLSLAVAFRSSCFLPSFLFFSFKPSNRYIYASLVSDKIYRYWINKMCTEIFVRSKFEILPKMVFFLSMWCSLASFRFFRFSCLFLSISNVSSKRGGFNLIGIKFDLDRLDGIFLRDWMIWWYKFFEIFLIRACRMHRCFSLRILLVRFC